ncbi:hypothetical protein OJAV_G00090810 [Oryzias javanicus]|uniref:Uncharacterized protein n=1 Tax=Oryzias javanicus TaxID=123683 RepID=A0A3S2PS16_ORYJA|nr:hypothetical protein OJAV_G00090810 [Oryzias javanicus]
MMLGKCLQGSEEPSGGRVSLEGCDPFSPLQEWLWQLEGHALLSRHTGECLTAPNGEYEGVRLQPAFPQVEWKWEGKQTARHGAAPRKAS